MREQKPYLVCPGGGVLAIMAPPERSTFFRLQVYERVGILLVEVYEKVGKSVIWVCERAQQCKGLTEEFYGLIKSRNESAFTSVKRDAKLLKRYVKGCQGG